MNTADRRVALAAVALKLAPRGRLEADAGQCLGLKRLLEGTNRALQRLQAHREPSRYLEYEGKTNNNGNGIAVVTGLEASVETLFVVIRQGVR